MAIVYQVIGCVVCFFSAVLTFCLTKKRRKIMVPSTHSEKNEKNSNALFKVLLTIIAMSLIAVIAKMSGLI